jgi:4-amino-4-deoxy-L-arabinose transferase-like glycosyltransferase
MDVNLTGELPSTIILQNNGWPLFVSIFFKFLDSGDFLDYMNLQSYLAIVISTITIIPLYFLSKKFVGSSFALLTTILFIFEPRIIANSLIGVTDPLFILLIVTSLALIVQKNKFIIYGACITIGLACIVRSEGLFLIPVLCIMFLIKNKITKINIIQCIIFIIIIYLILLPFSMQRIESTGNDFLVSRIIVSSSNFSEQTQNDPNLIFSKIVNSIYLFIGFLGRLMIPYLVIFVPIGIILFFKEKNIQKSLLIIPVFFMILPSLYAYTVPALDSRYIFPILPILCIVGTFACMKYLGKIKYKKIGITVIIIIIIFSSTLFLNYKNSDVENEQEFLKLANIINEKTDILLYIKSPINSYLDPAQLLKFEKFPVMSSYYSKNSKLRSVDYNSIEDFFLNTEKNGITHIVLDDEVDNPIIIKEIFGNYEEYENLKKIFDSQENGFDYKIKIFEMKY